MRVALGVVIVAVAWFIVLPVVLVVGGLFALGLFCGGAIALAHVGALSDPHIFAAEHWRLAPLVLFSLSRTYTEP